MNRLVQIQNSITDLERRRDMEFTRSPLCVSSCENNKGLMSCTVCITAAKTFRNRRDNAVKVLKRLNHEKEILKLTHVNRELEQKLALSNEDRGRSRDPSIDEPNEPPKRAFKVYSNDKPAKAAARQSDRVRKNRRN